MQVWSLCQEDPPGEKKKGSSLQYCLGNPMDRGARRVIVHWVTKRWTWVSKQHSTEHLNCPQSNLQPNTLSSYVFPRISSFPHRRLLFLILRKRSYSMCLEHHRLAFLSLKISFISQALAQISPPLGSPLLSYLDFKYISRWVEGEWNVRFWGSFGTLGTMKCICTGAKVRPQFSNNSFLYHLHFRFTI